jgi:putative cardiolipin synthase
MVKSKYNPAFIPALPHRIGFGIAQGLKIFGILLATWVLLACATLPTPEGKTPSYSYEPRPNNRLAVVTRNLIQNVDDGHSGFFKLFRNDDAMRWRLLLADMAEETLDMQYFLWKGDASGDLLLDRVIKAADRGVRVRILVDDIFIIGKDRTVAALSQHPNIEMGIHGKHRTT